MTIRERVLQRFDNRLGDIVLGRGALEAVFDRERHLDRTNVVFDRPDGSLEDTGAEARPDDGIILVEIVFEAAHLASLGILI